MASKPTAVVHNFARSLDVSTKLNGEVDWVALYRNLWPDMVAAVRVDCDCEMQRRGVDRLILMPDRRQFTIDEKVRPVRADGKIFDDFLIEEFSDLRRQTPGWTLDPHKVCDYVAYAIVSVGKCYLLPFEILRLTCAANLEAWKPSRRPIDVPNNFNGRSWHTRNWTVKWITLFDAMQRQMTLKYGGKVEVRMPTPRKEWGQLTFDWDAANPEESREDEEDEVPF